MGQAIARRFAAEGAEVLVAGRQRPEVLKLLAAEIGGYFALCDIADPSSVTELTRTARGRWRDIDIAVNASGWGLLRPFLDTSVEDIDTMSAIQLRGPMVFFQEMIRAMPGGGSIIQISSVVATIMCPDHAIYQATKAATDHLIRIVANEFVPKEFGQTAFRPL